MVAIRTTGRPPHPRAVLFDWDNTLAENWACVVAAYNDTRMAFGHEPISMEDSYRHIQSSLRDAFPRLFGDQVDRARKHFADAFERNHLQGLRPLHGARDLLNCLEKKGIHRAIVSNKTGRFLRAELAHLEWTHLFAAAVGAGDAAHDKPSAAAVQAALSPIGIAPGPDVWLVGDAPVDIDCARAAGCTGILVTAGAPERHEWPAGAPEFSVATCADLVHWLAD